MHLLISSVLGLFILGLSACSSPGGDVQAPEMAEIQSGGETSLRENNPFEWSNEDIQRDESGNFAGGKRSAYDQKKIASYGKSRKVPGYLTRDYHSKAWNGSKDYSTGSYQDSTSFQGTQKKSWIEGEKSSADQKMARGSKTNYQAGDYRTGSAGESGQGVSVPESGYLNSRRSVKRKPLLMIEKDEYRQLSVGQSRSLLGKE